MGGGYSGKKRGRGEKSNKCGIMKRLCTGAGVDPKKVHPYALRLLFARLFYDITQDIAKLADLLGHSAIETTRIYIMTSSREHRTILDHLTENLSAKKKPPHRSGRLRFLICLNRLLGSNQVKSFSGITACLCG